MIKTALELLRFFYPALKWILVGYAIWVVITYMLVSLHRFTKATMAPICSQARLRPYVPLCDFANISDRPPKAAKMTTPEEGLAAVLDQTAQNYDLARDMIRDGFAIENLKTRVKASNLPRKEKLTAELDFLYKYTRETSR